VIDVLRNEWRLVRRDAGFRILVAAYALLLAYGAAVGIAQARTRQAQIAEATADYHGRWATLREAAEVPGRVWADWRSPSLVGGSSGAAITWMELDGLSALSTGDAVRQPTLARVSIYAAGAEPPLANPLAIVGGVFDFTFVVVWLLPIAVAVAGHAVVSGDRQRGSWRLIAATTPRPARLVIARLAWPSVTLATLTIAGGVAAATLAGGFTNGAAGRLLIWIVAVLGYTAFWASVTAVVSIRTAQAPTSLLTLGLLWLVVVWLVPGLIDAATMVVHPPPNRLQGHLAERDAQRDPEVQLPKHLEAIYAQHPGWRPSAEAVAAANTPVPGGPASRDSRRVYAPARAAAEAAAPFARAEQARRVQAAALAERLSVLSPALALQALSDHAAGTSETRLAGFRGHVVDAEEVWRAFFAPRIMQLREMTRDDMRVVPTPTTYAAHVPAAALIWPMLGLLGPLAAAIVLFGRARPALRA
jgi:ABC-2 type transport system permease protein